MRAITLQGSSLGELGGLNEDIGSYVASMVVPPIVKEVKGQVPALLTSLQPTLQSQATTFIHAMRPELNSQIESLRPIVEGQAKVILGKLQPELQNQAQRLAIGMQPFLNEQLNTAERRLNVAIDRAVDRIAQGEQLKRLKREVLVGAAIGLGVQAAVILGGMFVIEAIWGRH